MKPLLLAICLAALTGCTTVDTFGPDGKVLTRTRKPSPETWTVISNAVSMAGASAVKAWADQMSDQQRWERGDK